MCVRKTVRDANHSVGIYLHSEKEDRTLNWTRAASAEFKLLSFDSKQDIISGNGIGYGSLAFISWADLFDAAKNFVKDDTIQLEIKIKAEDPNENDRSQLKLERIEKCCGESWMAIWPFFG